MGKEGRKEGRERSMGMEKLVVEIDGEMDGTKEVKMEERQAGRKMRRKGKEEGKTGERPEMPLGRKGKGERSVRRVFRPPTKSQLTRCLSNQMMVVSKLLALRPTSKVVT